MGRRLDWFIHGTPWRPSDEIDAAAAVALASPRSRVGIASPFSPPLEPFTPYVETGWCNRSAALTVPALQRCHDLITSAVSALPMQLWSINWTTVPAVEQQLPPYPWLLRPDPNRTRQWLLAWTTDDLFFYGVAHWEIVDRYASTGYPSAFARIEPGALTEQSDGWHVTETVSGVRRPIQPKNIVEFLSPNEGILASGWRTISIALQLDAAADRFASAEIPAGVLEEQDGSEDMTVDELTAIALQFSQARQTNTTAALNKYMRYREIQVDASAMQLVEGRSYQALEMARLGNVPPYLVGAPAGTGMTYQNGQQARQDLVDFGAQAFISCIEQTLSGPNVTPRGQAVRLDLNAWLRNPFTLTDAAGEQSPNDIQIAVDQEPA